MNQMEEIKSLLRQQREIKEKLKSLGVCTTGNNPLGDYAEFVACKEFGLTKQSNPKKGYYAVSPETGERYQIKSRMYEKRSSYQLGAIRGLDSKPFDHLIVLLVNPLFEVVYTLVIPYEDVVKLGKYQALTNSHLVIINHKLIDEYKLQEYQPQQPGE